eukprot:4626679-Prymnesium_polylepis.1
MLEAELGKAIEERELKLFPAEDFVALLDARQQLCALHSGKLPPRVKSTLHLRAQSLALDGEIEVRQTHLETL